MDFVTMVDRTYDGFRDSGREFITPDEVKAWLNEAQRDIAYRRKNLHQELEDVVPGSQEIPMPADLIQIKSLRFGDSTVTWRDDSDWWQAMDSLVTNPWQGPYGRVWEGAIEVYPPPAVGDPYTLRYIYEPPDLVADADVSPHLLPDHTKMYQYARAQGFLRLNEMEHAEAQMALYERGLPEQTHTRNVPMPMTLGYEPTPFDRQLDQAHRG